MNLYYFKPESYGEEAFVCAESPEKAKEALKKVVIESYDEYGLERIDNMINLKNGYTLEVYAPGVAVFTEIS